MSLLKNIKSLFIVEDEKGEEKVVEPPRQEELPKAEQSNELKKESTDGEKGRVLKKFTDTLVKAMQEQNLEGFDYLEYKQSLRSLQKMEMDDPTRYKSAYAMAQTMGAAPEKLIKSAEFYIKVLKGEEEKFEAALLHQRAQKVESKDKALNRLQEQVKKKEEQIDKLRQEIEAHRQKMEELKVARIQAAAGVETIKNNFIASYNAIVAQITRDIENMKKFLK